MPAPKPGPRIDRLCRYMALIFMLVFMVWASMTLWLLPVRIVSEAFYQEWLRGAGGHVTFWSMIAWFHWGAAKILAVAIRDRRQEFCRMPDKAYRPKIETWPYRAKMLVLVPFAPMMDCRLTRPYFPMPGDRDDP